MIRFVFAVGLVFLFPAFTFQLAFDPVSFTFTGSVVLKIINVGCELYALTMILGSRQAIVLVLRCRPILVLVGMAFASTAWSHARVPTFQAANVFLTTALFGVAMAARLPPTECLRLVIRTMVLGCVLSVIWVIVFPQEAVHQATDLIQSVHAGLWRGIFSHKQGLGVFAGLTLGLLLFYGSIVFSSLVVRVGAIGCAVACLIGSQSRTGQLTTVITFVMFYTTYAITHFSPEVRKAKFTLLIVIVLSLIACFHLGVLDWMPRLLGKSSDLTGRGFIWPLVLESFRNSGAMFFGGGFGNGFALALTEFSVDNGYIDKIVEFGYVGSIVIFAVFASILLAGRQLIINTCAECAAIDVFPFCMMFVVLFINISEGNFMSKCICTVLTAIAVAFIAQARVARDPRTAGVAARNPMGHLQHTPAE